MSSALVNGITIGYDDSEDRGNGEGEGVPSSRTAPSMPTTPSIRTASPGRTASSATPGADPRPTPLLLVHGHPFDRTMWCPQTAAFGAGRRVIAPDLRGYGRTSVRQGSTGLDVFARDLAGLLDTLGVDRVVVCGLSMGGQIVLEFHRLFAERVAGLVLADTFAQGETPQGRRERYARAEELERDGMDGYAHAVLDSMVAPATVRDRPEVAAHVLGMMRAAPPAGAAAALRGRAERPDYTPTLARIAVPTLVVVGRDDVFTPVADARFLHERVAGSRLVIVEGAGHMPNLERPDAFNAALADLLAAVPEAAEGTATGPGSRPASATAS
ncbi:Pimeloyl-ACP methyl ester carboxylesterase [Actinacidiphila yanglinensis]|uniref:Pimeloyl-ACP methyl ester carboxylesterase n=1 Tax=Actinacidiphila yanglinensis TaxID=310779 RepID=A0A1H6DZ17_9ACTN|nr:alpha/beta fold hydrolase [Actinacidiphila yanglinensis]SEG90063.1 Pimeloyl-ACP methyl ester carboxylesterase [Actinacidiphila yanglinensis]